MGVDQGRFYTRHYQKGQRRQGPHDLRRHGATDASRSGLAIEIVNKVIPRRSYPSTTQRYLGKISDSEAARWIENLYG
jgi:integrase/recombinase XerD